MSKDIKHQALKDYKNLKKLLKSAPTTYDELYEYLKTLPLFVRYTHTSNTGLLEFLYGSMTLKILLKNAIIELQKEIVLWNLGDSGYLGTFTEKTLSSDANGDLD